MTTPMVICFTARARNQDYIQTWRLGGINILFQEAYGYALREQYLRDWLLVEGSHGCR